VIPGRGGSVRIPRKNIKLFHGKPIIEYSIETALDSRLFDEVIVSTDDEEIARIAGQAGAWIHWRDPDDGTRGTQEVTVEVLKDYPDCSIACCLYATAPLITPSLLIGGYQSLVSGDGVFAYATDRYRKDIGAFYWGFAWAFIEDVSLYDRNSVRCWMDPQHCCDINTPEDFSRAEAMYAELHR
jgi:N-acylneuraminate cytidylyltransferase